MKKIRILGLCLALALAGSGCAKQASSRDYISLPETTAQPETASIQIETEAETEAETESYPEERVEVDGMIRSYLTGEMVPVSQGNRRPLAIMMSNDKEYSL